MLRDDFANENVTEVLCKGIELGVLACLDVLEREIRDELKTRRWTPSWWTLGRK